MDKDAVESQSVDKLLLEFRKLHGVCTTTLDRSFEGERSASMAKSFLFTGDLAGWSKALTPSPEATLYARAEQEYLASLINVAQGQYCNAFKGLRLVLELTIQGVYLSANLVELNEWLRNSLDTNWSTLMDSNKGPISARFTDSFYPDLAGHVDSFSTMARTLYRELSETIHGNIPKHIPLPSSFAFDEDTFELWHRKAATVRITCLFCLAVRYLTTMSEEKRGIVENSVTEQLGHIAAIRILFGGPSTL
jgi:hypothetical protein